MATRNQIIAINRGVQASTPSGVPGSAINITAGQNIQSFVNANPVGASFLLHSGTYRLTEAVIPKQGQAFFGEPGVIIKGSKVLTGWTKDGAANRWFVTGQTQGGSSAGECIIGYDRCGYPEDVFINNVPLTAVTSIGAVVSGTFFFDYTADRIYIGDNPASGVIETSVMPLAFGGNATDVYLNNLSIQMFAAPTQQAAIMGGANWTLEYLDALYNHGYGIQIVNQRKINYCKANHNGQLGIGGSGSDYSVAGTEIAYNNYANYTPAWEAGGTKFAFSNNFSLQLNYAHHNSGPGLWLDIDNYDYSIVQNVCEDNFSPNMSNSSGIFVEISYNGTIHDNYVSRNGAGFNDWMWGAGIVIAASGSPGGSGGSGIIVYNNVVTDNEQGIALIQQPRGSGAFGPYLVQNVYVYNNFVRTAGAQGAVQDIGDDLIFTARNNRFDYNVYDGVGSYYWNNGPNNFAAWQGYGMDLHTGTITENGVNPPAPTISSSILGLVRANR